MRRNTSDQIIPYNNNLQLTTGNEGQVDIELLKQHILFIYVWVKKRKTLVKIIQANI